MSCSTLCATGWASPVCAVVLVVLAVQPGGCVRSSTPDTRGSRWPGRVSRCTPVFQESTDLNAVGADRSH